MLKDNFLKYFWIFNQ